MFHVYLVNAKTWNIPKRAKTSRNFPKEPISAGNLLFFKTQLKLANIPKSTYYAQFSPEIYRCFNFSKNLHNEQLNDIYFKGDVAI